MTKRIISWILTLVLCISLAVTASAAPAVDFIIDELDYLTSDEVDALNDLAANLYDTCGVGIFFVFTESESLADYDIDRILGGITDYVIMMENDTSWYTFYGGKGMEIDAATEESLRDIYDVASTYDGGVEDFLRATAACFPEIDEAPAASGTEAPSANSPEAEEYLLFDDADLLTDAEEAKLTAKLLTVSHQYNAQIIIATVSSVGNGDVDGFLEYIYDYMEFGYGSNHDGVLLLVCMDPREYRILSNGFAGTAIDTGDIDSIGSSIVSDLSDGNYAEAFDTFTEKCAYYLDGHLNGFPFDFTTNLLIALVIGLIAGVIVAFVLKGQLKTVRKQDRANAYVKSGSMQVTVRNDFFLYRDITRTKKETTSSSSGGGSSRSTGGGSF